MNLDNNHLKMKFGIYIYPHMRAHMHTHICSSSSSSLAHMGALAVQTYMPLYAGGSSQGGRASSPPVCQQAKSQLSDSGGSDSPAESLPPS